MKLTTGQSCAIVVVLAFVIAGIQSAATSPIGVAGLLLALVGFVILMFYVSKKRKDNFQAQLIAQADKLDTLANGEFPETSNFFAAKKGEVVVLHLDKVILSEFRSSGSTYSGGYGGVSFRVAKGVRANVGGMKGSTTRNPEEATEIDVGGVTFTNQRFVFAGANQVREWDLDKLVNLEAGDNGYTLTIAVSNRDKASMLQAPDMSDLTPGMAGSIAMAWKESGKTGAMADAKDLADRLREAVAKDSK